MGTNCARDAFSTSVWLAYLAVLVLSAILACMSIALLQGLAEWAGTSTIQDISNLSDSVFGVMGSLVIMILMLGVYNTCSLIALSCRSCSNRRHGSTKIWFGMLPGCTFLMVFLSLQTALVLQSSHYLVDKDQDILTRLSYNQTTELDNEDSGDWVGEVKRLTDFPAFSGSNLFVATTKVAYVGAGAFAVLFLFLLAYELASSCLQDPSDGENAPLVEPTFVGRRNSGNKLPSVAKIV